MLENLLHQRSSYLRCSCLKTFFFGLRFRLGSPQGFFLLVQQEWDTVVAFQFLAEERERPSTSLIGALAKFCRKIELLAIVASRTEAYLCKFACVVVLQYLVILSFVCVS